MLYNIIGLPLEYCSREYRAQLKKAKDRTSVSISTPLWTPSDPEATAMSQYQRRINATFSQTLKDSHELHAWTVENPHAFWIDLYDYCGIIPPLPKHTKRAYNPDLALRDIPAFFPGLKLNYAENVLVPNTRANPNGVALIGLREGRLDSPEKVTWAELSELVRVARSALVRHGIKRDDVVAALVSNSIWAIVLFLATASIGAIFTSVSPDLGVAGCASRFAQVSPKLLFADVDVAVRGVRKSMLGKVQQILQLLPDNRPQPGVVFVPTCPRPHLQQNLEYTNPLGVSLHTFLQKSRKGDALSYTRVPGDHGLVIVYSSGTTGEPKCIVSPHMSLLNYQKIALLHNSLGPRSTVFQYSSTSWILWNVMNGHLSVGATVICFDGGPLYPDASTMLRICAQYGATYMGTSPRYLLELERAVASGSVAPVASYDLSRLATVTTTGATLTGEQFRWFYSAFPRDVQLSSVAGGTEIASSWIATDPAGAVYANEMQMWALGHACDILDSQTGQSVASTGEPGELVCRAPFPSMPSRFWKDTPDHQRYRAAYFEKFAVDTDTGTPSKHNAQYLDVWTQHDWTVMNPLTQGIQILGRSDGVLNPSGIRFGSSEIYHIVQSPTFSSVVADTLCVGRRRAHDPDEAVFLFVVMASGAEDQFTEDLVQRIKDAVRHGLSARHVPAFVLRVDEIPYTVNGKKVEGVVKRIISGLQLQEGQGGTGTGTGMEKEQKGGVVVSSTVANPHCLKAYERFRYLEREPRRERL